MSNKEKPSSIPLVPPSAPLFGWLRSRSAGVLLHPTALPNDQGVGVLDSAVDSFLEFLHAAGFRHWQICPLGPTGYGDSPYQCFSAFAGNPYLIDLRALVAAGLLTESDLEPLHALPRDQVDFGRLYPAKWTALFQVHAAFKACGRSIHPYGDFATFRKAQADWIEAYSFFMALKDHFGGQPWWMWPEEVSSHTRAQTSPLLAVVADRAEAYVFAQYLFFGQWQLVRAKARAAGIEVIGDAPIFAAPDSADVWTHPHLFQLDVRTRRPRAVAGCPPDYFSADGQHWGNPLYDWPAHAAEGYAWWLARLRANLALCDIVRLDHFRGFEAYWSIPAGAKTARSGHWENGPGLPFFRAVHDALPDCRLIAEDLGELTPGVLAMHEATGLPGMAVLQFAFGGGSDNFYLPHNVRANSVMYTGTHDNDTSLGWYRTADEKARDHVRRYLRVDGEGVGWDLIRAAYASVSRLAVIPLQDLLALGSEARFNTPGKPDGNWQWRYEPRQLEKLRRESAAYLRELASLYGRPIPATTIP